MLNVESKEVIVSNFQSVLNVNRDGTYVFILKLFKYVRYCGRDCQKADWPTHKVHCKEITQPWENTNLDWGANNFQGLRERINFIEKKVSKA